MSKREAVVEAMARAMQNAVIRDDEGEFPRLFDMLDFSGENKARTVVKGLATAALDAALSVLSEPDEEMIKASIGDHRCYAEDAVTVWTAMLSTLRSPEK